MIVEKSLKAVVASRTSEIPPKIHDLPKLANLAGLWDTLSEDRQELMKKLIPLQIEARYPEYKERIADTLTVELCKKILTGTEDFLCWIKTQLGR
jgi:HEPN domain-containing protein